MNAKGLANITGVATLAALVMALAGATSAIAAPFTNGDFQSPTVSGAYSTVTGPGTIGAWIVNGTVNHGKGPAATTCSTANGQCIDLNGNGPGGITQTFDNTCTYRVDFMMSRHMQLGAHPASLEAFVNNVSKGIFTHSVAGVVPTDGKWEPHSFNFVGTPSTTLAFKSKVMSGAAGPQIDNVTVKLVSCT